VTASQIVLAALVVAAFALGWVGRGRRERPAKRTDALIALDDALGEALTAFQATLGLWQLERERISPLGERALASFSRQHAAVRRLARSIEQPARPEIGRAIAALDAMAAGLVAYAGGSALGGDRERSLMRAERSLTGARHALLESKTRSTQP
jgi:hypothetical protein